MMYNLRRGLLSFHVAGWSFKNMRKTCFHTFLSALFFVTIAAGMAERVFAAPRPAISSASPLPAGALFMAYSFTFTATSGIPPYQAWTVTAGALPPGLTLNAGTGVLSGTPASTGMYSFSITVDDSATPIPKTSAAIAFSLTINPPSCAFTGGSSSGIISFSNIDPSSTGTIYGTVTQQVSFTCNVTPMAYTITVNPASGWMLQSGANDIPYTPGIAPSGAYAGAAVNLLIPPGVGATLISQPDYQNAPAGAYASSSAINMTVAWTLGGAGSIVATIPIGNVAGTVINTCAVAQSPGTLTFTMDPSVAGTTNATISPDMLIKCTKGDSVVISASSKCGGGAPRLDSAYPACGGSQIPYTFNFVSSATGLGFGTSIPLNIGGSTTSSNYQDAPVGTYGDLQTLTITY